MDNLIYFRSWLFLLAMFLFVMAIMGLILFGFIKAEKHRKQDLRRGATRTAKANVYPVQCTFKAIDKPLVIKADKYPEIAAKVAAAINERLTEQSDMIFKGFWERGPYDTEGSNKQREVMVTKGCSVGPTTSFATDDDVNT